MSYWKGLNVLVLCLPIKLEKSATYSRLFYSDIFLNDVLREIPLPIPKPSFFCLNILLLLYPSKLKTQHFYEKLICQKPILSQIEWGECKMDISQRTRLW